MLEALHYRPASEDGGRTASITWRLLEAATDPVPELHLIACSRPLEEELSLFLSSYSPPEERRTTSSERIVAQDDENVLGFALPHRSDARTERFRQNVDLLSTLRSCELDYCAFGDKLLPEAPQLLADGCHRRPRTKSESACHVLNQVLPTVDGVGDSCVSLFHSCPAWPVEELEPGGAPRSHGAAAPSPPIPPPLPESSNTAQVKRKRYKEILYIEKEQMLQKGKIQIIFLIGRSIPGFIFVCRQTMRVLWYRDVHFPYFRVPGQS